MMLRFAIAAGFAAYSLSAWAQTAASQFQGVTLRQEAVVTGDLVRIGDLVENSGALASTAIFRAPNLGETGFVTAHQIAEAILPHGLRVDIGGPSSVAVTRAGRVITAKDIEGRVARSLAEHAGLRDSASLEVTFDQPPRTVSLEPNSAEPRIVRVGYAPRAGRFDVTLEIPSADSSRPALHRLTGTVTDTIEVVSLTRAIARDQVIKPDDIIVERRPRSSVPGDPILSPQNAVGFAARRALRSGAALQGSDIAKPILVQRNEPVILLYEVPGIVVTLRGKAIDSGAEGEVVSVMNLQSKRTLHGVVIGPGHVSISSPHAPARLASETTGLSHTGGVMRRRTE